MNTGQKVGKVLGELESEIMEIVWQSPDHVSVKIVARTLQKKRKIAYTTVMTIMGRLVDKGLLKRRESDKAYIYQPAYSKEKFLTRISRQIIKNFITSFGQSAIAHFAEEVEKLAPEKRRKLQKILKQAKK
ncbi:BlaI/MecI/CopY family transcriptional regulator [Candidatus Daviesbacteria bacterium]|nr:BlaI/MecI/CopY family transcriptional regulator [Candidatus Daviesbacteria bacterium]